MSEAGNQLEVLQVGDVAGVAMTLTNGLRQHTKWSVRVVDLPQTSGGGRIHRALEIPGRGIGARRAVRSAVAQRQPDIVHVHWARFAPFVGTTGCPKLIHAHGSDVRGLSRSIGGRIVERALARADAVLVSTPDLIEELEIDCRYLPNPVDTSCFAPAADVPRADGRGTVLLFSQLIDIKGAPTLLASARSILASREDVRVLAISGGTYDAEAAKLGVQLVPRRTRTQLAELLAQVDVVVGQLRIGSLGLSELESMSCAKPVVTFLRPGLYPSDVPVISAPNAEDVAGECLRLLADQQASAMLGSQARSYIMRNHDEGVISRQLACIYEGLM
jgi:glycosyltransferase involved in cell wall biosynthesis